MCVCEMPVIQGRVEVFPQGCERVIRGRQPSLCHLGCMHCPRDVSKPGHEVTMSVIFAAVVGSLRWYHPVLRSRRSRAKVPWPARLGHIFRRFLPPTIHLQTGPCYVLLGESFVAPGSQQDAPNQARSKGASPECMKLLTSKNCRHTAGNAESVDVCGACLLWVFWAPSDLTARPASGAALGGTFRAGGSSGADHGLATQLGRKLLIGICLSTVCDSSRRSFGRKGWALGLLGNLRLDAITIALA